MVQGSRVLSNVIHSQTEHSHYGGVVPELASRNHIRKIVPVIRQALEEADLALNDLGGIAVTQGPGLVGCLLVGISTAKGLAFSCDLPLIGVHHIEGHIFAGLLEYPELTPPFLALVTSGGHTELIHVTDWGVYRILGRTRDDAAGEAFDKVAKMLGILQKGETTMGGPRLSALAESGNPKAFDFPRGLMDTAYEFSFSGIKTSVLYHVKDRPCAVVEKELPDIAASFEAAVVEVLVAKAFRAARDVSAQSILVTGGVAANRSLRVEMIRADEEPGAAVLFPSPIFCTDNAAMIAGAGAFRLGRGERSGSELDAVPRLELPGTN